jgi:hypothetical protein
MYRGFEDTDKNTLIRVCAQRISLSLRVALEDYYNENLQGSDTRFHGESSCENECITLRVIHNLLEVPDTEKVDLIVKERLPSILVKTLKALSSSKSEKEYTNEMIESISSILRIIIRFSVVCNELIDSSTLHRLFCLTFDDSSHQLLIYEVYYYYNWYYPKCICN